MKKIASISIDLDDKWAFLKTHGDASWEGYPSYLPEAMPIILEFLKKRKCRITFFIIGRDAAFEYNRDFMRSIANAGHEIGNHTFYHDPWIQRYSYQQIDRELRMAEEVIEAATGQIPRGFRGPAFTFSPILLAALKKRQYAYDASTFPSILNPLSRIYFFMSSRLSKEEREQRDLVFGNVKDGFKPLKAYKWSLPEHQSLVEIPVTTFPFLRFPIHMTYILYLGKYSVKFALGYFRLAAEICRVRNIDLSILLSPTDFLGKEDDHGIPFFPAMDMPRSKKIGIIDGVLAIMEEKFQTVTMIEHAEAIEKRKNLKNLIPTR